MDNSQLFVLLTKMDDKMDTLMLKINTIEANVSSVNDDVSKLKQIVWLDSNPLADTPSEIAKINSTLKTRSDKYWGIVSGIISLALGLLINTSNFSNSLKPSTSNSATNHPIHDA
ncbi:MAG: hypothetical protein ACRDBG_13820 [Waterburya sp.]